MGSKVFEITFRILYSSGLLSVISISECLVMAVRGKKFSPPKLLGHFYPIEKLRSKAVTLLLTPHVKGWALWLGCFVWGRHLLFCLSSGTFHLKWLWFGLIFWNRMHCLLTPESLLALSWVLSLVACGRKTAVEWGPGKLQHIQIWYWNCLYAFRK